MVPDNALERVETSYNLLDSAQKRVSVERQYFARACKEAHEAGVPDRLIADMTGYSRARIQQFRCGDPRRKDS